MSNTGDRARVLSDAQIVHFIRDGFVTIAEALAASPTTGEFAWRAATLARDTAVSAPRP